MSVTSQRGDIIWLGPLVGVGVAVAAADLALRGAVQVDVGLHQPQGVHLVGPAPDLDSHDLVRRGPGHTLRLNIS